MASLFRASPSRQGVGGGDGGGLGGGGGSGGGGGGRDGDGGGGRGRGGGEARKACTAAIVARMRIAACAATAAISDSRPRDQPGGCAPTSSALSMPPSSEAWSGPETRRYLVRPFFALGAAVRRPSGLTSIRRGAKGAAVCVGQRTRLGAPAASSRQPSLFLYRWSDL